VHLNVISMGFLRSYSIGRVSLRVTDVSSDSAFCDVRSFGDDP